jgi:hypothetical protein
VGQIEIKDWGALAAFTEGTLMLVATQDQGCGRNTRRGEKQRKQGKSTQPIRDNAGGGGVMGTSVQGVQVGKILFPWKGLLQKAPQSGNIFLRRCGTDNQIQGIGHINPDPSVP